MPSAVEQPLNLLLPTASSLPPQLITAAESLLAQSKAKAPRLKPDEEIARAFACCHIACERLKNKFGLEIGKVGPPCGPRVYKKLYGFLEAALPAQSATPRVGRVKDVGTPKRVDEGKGTPKGVAVARITPKSQRATATLGSRAAGSLLGKRGREGVSKAGEEAELPRYTMHLIRHLSSTFDTPEAPTHAYAGVESVYRHLQTQQENEDTEPQTPSKRLKNDRKEAFEDNTADVMPTGEQFPSFVAAIYIQTVSAMYARDLVSGAEQRREVVESMQEYFGKLKTLNLDLDPNQLTSDIETYTREASTTGWATMEWYSNLPTVENDDDDDDDDDPVTPRKRPAKTPLRRKEKHAGRSLEDCQEEQSAAGLKPGLGTMFQPAVDWLSDERRADFAAWKGEVMRAMAKV